MIYLRAPLCNSQEVSHLARKTPKLYLDFERKNIAKFASKISQYEHELNVEEIVQELIEIQQNQEESYLSLQEMSGDKVNISEIENIEKYPDTISVTKN